MAAIAPEGVAWMTDIEKYFSFVLTMFLAFGVTFEIPVAVVLLARMGIVSVEKLKQGAPVRDRRRFRGRGAILTPPGRALAAAARDTAVSALRGGRAVRRRLDGRVAAAARAEATSLPSRPSSDIEER